MAEDHHGTSGDVELTDSVLEELADEAERGYDVQRLRPRGRPPLGSGPAEVFHVRLPPKLRAALDEAADAEGVSASDVVRRALAEYLG